MNFDVKYAVEIKNIVKKAIKPEGLKVDISRLKAISNQKPIISDANPLIMDAKANLAKVNINKNMGLAKEAIKYETFKENVIEEVKALRKSEVTKCMKAINPINSNNITQIRTELKYFTKDCDIDLQLKILDSETPDELFEVIKQNSVEISNAKNMELVESFCNKTPKDITPEMEQEYKMILTNASKRFRKFINLFTPKSTNPRVIKIEQEVRELGVKDVNFSDDLEQAKLIKEAITDLIKKKCPLPHSITITPALERSDGGITTNAINGDKRQGYIYLQTVQEKKLSEQMDEKIEKLIQRTNTFKNTTSAELKKQFLDEIHNIKQRDLSTSNPKHKIYHEVAHTFQPLDLESELKELSDDDMEIASSISLCAKRKQNGKEAMPEIFAMLMDEQKLTYKKMELYLKLGGIVPQF